MSRPFVGFGSGKSVRATTLPLAGHLPSSTANEALSAEPTTCTSIFPRRYHPDRSDQVLHEHHRPPVYHHNSSSPTSSSPPLPYPPRPIPNAILDLDVVMDYCDFSTNQYVRDCLEILRMGGGLDIEKRVRRGETARWRHVYHEQNDDGTVRAVSDKPVPNYDPALHAPMDEERGEQMIKDPSYQPVDVLSLIKSEAYPQKLRDVQKQVHNTADSRRQATSKHPSHPTADPTCDIDYPKIFHIFWAGPFTDKPYLALSSFLFTQNLGLNLPLAEPPKGARMTKEEQDNFARRSKFLSAVCRPQMWVWINPGPAAAIPNPNARREMFDDLRDNPWSAPFLHPRFREVIKFKMWNTTEHLMGSPNYEIIGENYLYSTVEELSMDRHLRHQSNHINTQQAPMDNEAPDVVEEELGRFGNHTRGEAAVAEDMSTPTKNQSPDATASASAPVSSSTAAPATTTTTTTTTKKVKMNCFRGLDLLHQKGMIDCQSYFQIWQRLGKMWGWRGQFAYRWSRLEKYNTAVLRLHRHSAVGSFLFKTALANGLDFHPMTISRYTKDAYLDGLLLRLPDALFDSAWLNTEYYQRDRPAFPYFKRFEDFFDPPRETDAGPAAIGLMDSSGAHSVIISITFGGPRFEEGERIIRGKALAAKQLISNSHSTSNSKNKASSSNNNNKKKNEGKNTDQLHNGHEKSREELESELIRSIKLDQDDVADDERDLGWATVLKRTFEAYLRCERPNMYGEWIDWVD
ncbi:hypothetical protein KEM48_012737 [Puccinia striiformis f. sp. tritici PST-130]|nr:hypothetical protein KEM48_012737 [Puccinia striiformis f. sp. tritici PST-130]